MGITVADITARYTAVYGKPSRNAIEKIKALAILNPSGCCPYCGLELLGGTESEFDHVNGNGGFWRENLGITTREEIATIIAPNRTHPEQNERQFLCSICNSVKKNTPEAEFKKTGAYKWVSKTR